MSPKSIKPDTKAKTAPKSKPEVKSSSKPSAPKKKAAVKPTAKKTQTSELTPANPKLRPVETPSKQSQLIELLRSDKGATLDQMMKLTSWQPHTVRGTLSGVLRKRLGLVVSNAIALDTGTRVYRIVESAEA